MGKFKAVTHWLAVGLAVVTGFAVSPAGQALVRQYPKASGLFGFLAALGALYHTPRAVPD